MDQKKRSTMRFLKHVSSQRRRVAAAAERLWAVAWWQIAAEAVESGESPLSLYDGRVMARASAGAALANTRALLPEATCDEGLEAALSEVGDAFEEGASFASSKALAGAMRRYAAAVAAE